MKYNYFATDYKSVKEFDEWVEELRRGHLRENHMHLNTFRERLIIYYKIERRKFLDYLKKRLNNTIKKVQGEV